MPLSDKARIANEYAAPRIVALWNAITALRSVVSFMNTGAHPDDEISAMLAALRFRDGIDISYACSTRGEGGQNDIGTETSQALGVLRTAEMEAACDRLDLRMYWFSESPDDTIFDFGFSKSGTETLETWGRARTLSRFVDIVRRERPDIICPTFLDVPGQHGHHRAMTEAAHQVMDLAADPGFDANTLPQWQVKKLYLPAWSGAGQAYDDDLPPPAATLTIDGKDRDLVTGWSFARIGQQSRAMHATQAMGRWVPFGDETDFPLHLVRSHVAGGDTDLTSGLATTLADLPAPEARDALKSAQDHIEAVIGSFPITEDVVRHASAAVAAVRRAIDCLTPQNRASLGHKLVRKEEQLSQVIRIAVGADVRGIIANDVLRPGDRTAVAYEVAHEIADIHFEAALPDGWTDKGDALILDQTAQTSDAYPDTYLPGLASPPCVMATVTSHGVTTRTAIAFETTPVVVPPRSATLTPKADVINVMATNRSLTVRVDDARSDTQSMTLNVPNGWQTERSGNQFNVEAPADVATGLYILSLKIDGQDASSVQHIARSHIAPRAFISNAQIKVNVIEAAVPNVRVGYIGGGNDRVAHWLERMGVDVTDLSETDLSKATLASYDTLVVGIFAMKFRPGLSDALPLIHQWVHDGGTLVTLYHRPWDNWDPESTAPYRLEIGQPSLRWRVTDQNADVTILAPDHPLLTTPNCIGPDDWANWHKERGLYFAKDWEASYTPLISMHDAGEAPLKGAWLAANYGKGRHVHTSLILHHQMEVLTPGAFRIMANLLASRS